MMLHPLPAILTNPLEYFILNTFHYHKTNFLVVLVDHLIEGEKSFLDGGNNFYNIFWLL